MVLWEPITPELWRNGRVLGWGFAGYQPGSGDILSQAVRQRGTEHNTQQTSSSLKVFMHVYISHSHALTHTHLNSM